jgi:hypothetical protein
VKINQAALERTRVPARPRPLRSVAAAPPPLTRALGERQAREGLALRQLVGRRRWRAVQIAHHLFVVGDRFLPLGRLENTFRPFRCSDTR